ncbi:mechanosensitive ion channel family protein [Aeromonas bestiarum]|uniref:mechanosensitive ion channel family protein n=1 Tax=Aeromonas TaxID=642 RepID=UPI0023796FA0|nr:mechanosensitive ion channel family protein [Aeromonas bestiarum]MDM5090896.1 mechanosensitive ion channel family protein [Aeromonas bestiarum]WDL83025.1 mechanosensitive ion channel [Aeromonas bestiarum]
MFSDHLIALPTLLWIGEHPFWTLLTLSLLATHFWRSPGRRRELVAELGFVMLSTVTILLIQFEGGWFRLPLPHHWLVEISSLLAGLVLVKVWGILLFQFLLPLCQIRIPRIIADIVITVGYIGWCLFRLYASGMALGEIVTTSAVITAVIAFSMQDTLGNLLAGVSIQLDNSIAIGDWLQVETTQGRVVEINWRATTIETRNWETVVIPNSHLLKQRFTVLGRRQNAPLQWRRWVWFDITLDTLPTQIIALVEHSLRETRLRHVSASPMPDCLLMNVENGVARYAVRYWLTDLAVDDPTDSAVRTLIDAALRRNDRRLTPPIFNVFMTTDQDHKDQRHKRHTAERTATLRRLPLFAMLQEEELLQLADQVKFAPFVNGDRMLTQGEISGWLFVLVKGDAEMLVEVEGRELLLGTLSAGDFFGELSLLTGEPSPFTVRALGTVETYRINQAMFQELVMQRESLVEPLYRVLSARQQEQQALLVREAESLRQVTPPRDLLDKLKALFGGL